MLPDIAALLARVVRYNQDHRLVRLHSPLDSQLLLVHRLRANEGLSRPFRLKAELLSPYTRLELKQMVGQPLRFTLALDKKGGERHFHGYVREFARLGSEGRMVRYEAEVVPWFSFLDLQVTCRAFQDLSVIEIVQQVFRHYGALASFRFDLATGRYPKLPYCVQYNESDFDFVSRLLEDHGIYYVFEHEEEGHTMVMADDSTRAQAIDGEHRVRFHAHRDTPLAFAVEDWNARRRVTPSVHSLKSFDFKQPRSPLSSSSEASIPRGVLPPLERYVYDGAARYGNSAVGDLLAAVRAEESGWKTKLFEGSATWRRMAPGRYFELSGHVEHDADPVEQREFLVLDVDHQAQNNFLADFSEAEGVGYEARLTALRRQIPYRPERLTARPRMPGPQTATVVGPAGEEMWADRFGRVKIQFHWDREGAFDQRSSCWVRVASPWAGQGMGGVSIPRVRQEVVVDFLDGNPDRPIITGRVYNADNMPPFGLQVSGIRSKTVNGSGFNELTMHDTAGGELLNMHAQRNMATVVQNDQTSTVNNNKATTVANNHTEDVGVDQTMSVGSKQALKVGTDRSIDVGANQTLTVGANRTATVTGNDTRTVTGTSTSTVTGAVAQTYHAGQRRDITAGGYTESTVGNHGRRLQGNYDTRTTGTVTEFVTGAVSETLMAGRTTSITGLYTRSVTGPVDEVNQGLRTLSVDGSMEHEVSGTHLLQASGDLTLVSGSTVRTGVGESGITIDGSSVVITAGGATIKVDASGVTVNGSKINLNC